MSLPIDPREKLIVIPARIFGPTGQLIVRLVLDTGATTSMLSRNRAIKLGYEPNTVANRVEVTTASSTEFAPLITVEQIESLGQHLHNFAMLCYTLPPSTGVDGVLGLDFLRGHRLVIDFRIGLVSLE
jgi:predicted aspartyl protease